MVRGWGKILNVEDKEWGAQNQSNANKEDGRVQIILVIFWKRNNWVSLRKILFVYGTTRKIAYLIAEGNHMFWNMSLVEIFKF